MMQMTLTRSMSVAGSLVLSVALAVPAFAQQEGGGNSQAGLAEKVLEGPNPLGAWQWEQRFGRQTIVRFALDEAGQLTAADETPPTPGRGGFGGNFSPPSFTNIQLVGDKFSFEMVRQFGEREFATKFAGVISGDEIAGMTSANFGGRVRESAWMATRVEETNAEEAGTVAQEEPSTETADDDSEPSESEVQAIPAEIPSPARIPSAGDAADSGAYQPQAILPGGIVIPLYDENSTWLNADRIGEAEELRISDSVHGRINSIVNIHNPSIEVHFASPNMNTGAVVILAAGGGHRTLNVGTESADFVPFFYNYGVNTVILRNRLRSDGYEPTVDGVRDALQAIRVVRAHADKWNFDPQRIGIMGFSAGAELAAAAALQFEDFDKQQSGDDEAVSSRPDFVGLIYPGPTPFTRNPDLEFPRNCPPAFITCAGAGDRIHAIWATDYLSAMLRAGIPNVEMHIYGNGFHPGDRGSTGGLTFRAGIPFGTWQNRFVDWFGDLGFLTEKGSTTKAAEDSAEFAASPPRRRRFGRPQ